MGFLFCFRSTDAEVLIPAESKLVFQKSGWCCRITFTFITKWLRDPKFDPKSEANAVKNGERI